MRLALRFHIVALAVVFSVIACNKPAQETTPATPAQPAAQEPSSSAPAAEPGKTESAPRAPESSPPEPAVPKAAAPKAASKAPAPDAAAPKSQPAPIQVVEVPAGTTLTVAMIDDVGTDKNKPGDSFMASIAEPVVVNGKTVLPKNARVRGRVQTVDEPGRVKGKAAMSLVLTQIISGGRTYAIATQPFTAQAAAGTKKDAIKVGGGAAIGAVIGAIAGGGKGAAIGAAAGGGAGTAAVLATKGDHIKIDSETKVNFVLKNDVKIETTKSPT